MRKGLLLTVLVSLLGTNTFAAGTPTKHETVHKHKFWHKKHASISFDKRKEIELEKINGEIKIYQDEKACIESAKDTKQLWNCKKKARIAEKELYKKIHKLWKEAKISSNSESKK